MTKNYEKIRQACIKANPKLMELKVPQKTNRTSRIDITGKRFGKLIALRESTERGDDGAIYWNFKCDCGKEKVASGVLVRGGHTQSCGCLRSEVRIQHGQTGSLTYKVWTHMKIRCLDAKNKSFPNYGGRGVKVCERWITFENFFQDMGVKPKGLSLDRIDVNGDYSPENCRWASMKVQQNNRRNNKLLTFQGETLTMSQWSEKVGLNYKTLKARIRNGWDIKRALKPLQ
jgi:hypothetical protein